MSSLDSSAAKTNNRKDPRCRRWCFTLNNPLPGSLELLVKQFGERGAKYVIGREIGEEGTPHLQGYVNFNGLIRFSTLKRQWPRCHWEAARGSEQQNIKYCSKDGGFPW